MSHPDTEIDVLRIEDGIEPKSPGARKADCLGRMLDERIKSFQKRREKNRGAAFRLRLTVIAAGAITTVILGLDFGPAIGTELKNAALLTSAIATVFSAWEAFVDNRGLWIKYTKARAQLFALRGQLDYLLSGTADNPPEDLVDRLFHRYQDVLDEVNASWLKGRLQTVSETPSRERPGGESGH